MGKQVLVQFSVLYVLSDIHGEVVALGVVNVVVEVVQKCEAVPTEPLLDEGVLDSKPG
jgi:hypothetical protein